MTIEKTEFSYPSSNGEHQIYATTWTPSKPNSIRAVLQVAHGMAEHTDRYDDFARYLAAQGFVVCANDHAGHGRSLNADGDFGYFGKEDGRYHLVADMHTLTQAAKKQLPNKPYFLLGHSMGSFLSRLYVTRFGRELHGAIFMGTGGENPLVDVAIAISKQGMRLRGEKATGRTIDRLTFGGYNKGIKHAKTQFDWLSANAENVQSFLSDKRAGFTFTYSAFYQLFSLVKEVTTSDWAKKVDAALPILFIAGKEDPVGSYGKGVEQSYRLLAEQGVKDLTLQLYDGMRHEILNEKNNLQVYEFVKMWMEKRMNF